MKSLLAGKKRVMGGGAVGKVSKLISSLAFLAPNQRDTQATFAKGSPTNTYTRSTLARVPDFEGILRDVQINCPSFSGLRLVENRLLYSEDFSNAIWLKLNGGTGSAPSFPDGYGTKIAPDGTTSATRVVLARGASNTSGDYSIINQQITGQSNPHSVVASIWMKSNTGVNQTVLHDNVSGTDPLLIVTPEWQQFAVTAIGETGTVARLSFGTGLASGASQNIDINIWHPLLQIITGAINQNPSEYLATTSAALTAWKDYANPYTVDGNGVVTDSGVRTSIIPNAWYKAGAPLLSEPAATNLCLQSQDFSTTWAGTGLLAFGSGSTVNATTAPDGTVTADKISEDTANSLHRTSQIVVAANTTYSFSCFLKAAERTEALVTMSDGTTGVITARVNLSTGAILTDTDAAGSWTGITKTSTSFGNGWYQVTVSGVKAAGANISLLITCSNGTLTGYATAYTGTANSGIYLWGAQLETGSVATSYMPTTTGTTTRGATSDGYDQANSKLGDITVYCEFALNSTTGTLALFRHGVGTLTTTQWELALSANILYFSMTNGSIYSSATKAFTPIVGTTYKILGKLSGSTMSLFINGVKGTDGTLTGPQSVCSTDILVGGAGGLAGVTNGYFGACKIYNIALDDATCIRLTS